MSENTEYKGLSIVPGRVIAPLILIDCNKLNIDTNLVLGKIAVIRVATPAIVLWLRNAAGLVVERGGIASHGAILAREFNIPSIVGIEGIYDRLSNDLLGELQSDLGILKVWT